MNDQPSTAPSGPTSSRVHSPAASTFSLHGPAPTVGYLDIVDGFCIATRVRPHWVHRLAMRLVLGWKWRAA